MLKPLDPSEAESMSPGCVLLAPAVIAQAYHPDNWDELDGPLVYITEKQWGNRSREQGVVRDTVQVLVDVDGKTDVLKLFITVFGTQVVTLKGAGRTLSSAPASTCTMVFEIWERDAEKDPLARAKKDVQLFFDKEVPLLVGDKAVLAKSSRWTNGKAWCTARVPIAAAEKLMEKSGTKSIIVREFITSGQKHSFEAVPFPVGTSMAGARDLAKKVIGNKGIASSAKGLVLRVPSSKLATARKELLGESGRAAAVVENFTYLLKGAPRELNRNEIQDRMLKAGWTVRAHGDGYMSLGIQTWRLGSTEEAPFNQIVFQHEGLNHPCVVRETGGKGKRDQGSGVREKEECSQERREPTKDVAMDGGDDWEPPSLFLEAEPTPQVATSGAGDLTQARTVFGHAQESSSATPSVASQSTAPTSCTQQQRKDIVDAKEEMNAQIQALRSEMHEMEARSRQEGQATTERLAQMEQTVDAKFGEVDTQLRSVAASTGEVGTKVQSLEDLIRGMAVGQAALQQTMAKMDDNMTGFRDETLRMNLKRAADPSAEVAAAKKG